MGRKLIRSASTADILEMLRMGRAFVETGVDIPFDPAYAQASLRGHLEAEGRLSLVLDLKGKTRGMLCAAWVPSPLAPVRIATELVFWIDPEARGRWAVSFIRAYEAWARDAGCSHVSLIARARTTAGQLYERLGYEPAEQTFSKALS
jgi:GNAT superfamily N-acetyltransferase